MFPNRPPFQFNEEGHFEQMSNLWPVYGQRSWQTPLRDGGDRSSKILKAARLLVTAEETNQQSRPQSWSQKGVEEITKIASASNTPHTSLGDSVRQEPGDTASGNQDIQYAKLGKLLTQYHELRDLHKDAEREVNTQQDKLKDTRDKVETLKEQLRLSIDSARILESAAGPAKHKRDELVKELHIIRTRLNLED